MTYTKIYRVCVLGFWSHWKEYSRLASHESILHPGMHVLRVWPKADSPRSYITHADRFELR